MIFFVFFKMFDKIKLVCYFCKIKWGFRKGRINLSCFFLSLKWNISRIYWLLFVKEVCRVILIENLLFWFCFFIFVKVLFYFLKWFWMINFLVEIYLNWFLWFKERVIKIFISNIIWFILFMFWWDKFWINYMIFFL